MSSLTSFLKENNSDNSVLIQDIAKVLIQSKRSVTIANNIELKIHNVICSLINFELTDIEKLAFEHQPCGLISAISSPFYVSPNDSYVTIAKSVVTNLTEFFEESKEEHNEWIEAYA